jgi:hypothetical protein
MAEVLGRWCLRSRDAFSQHGGASRTRRTVTGWIVTAPAV